MTSANIIHSIEGYSEKEITQKRGKTIIEDGSLKEWEQILEEYGIDKNCAIIVKSDETDAQRIAYTHHAVDSVKTPHVIVLKTLRIDVINDAFDFLFENFGIKFSDEADVLRNYLAHVYLHEFHEAKADSKNDEPDSVFDFLAFKRLRKSLSEEMILKVGLFHLAVDDQRGRQQ